jgi:hypothetical protein
MIMTIKELCMFNVVLFSCSGYKEGYVLIDVV